MELGYLLNSNSRFSSYSSKFHEILVKNNVPFKIIDPSSVTLLDDLKQCTHLLFKHSMGDTDKMLYEAIFHIAHNVYHIECFPNYETFWPNENKIREYYLLKSNDFPIIDSVVFWNYQNAESFIQNTQFPVVAKLPKGAGSENVILVNSYREGKKIIRQVFNEGVRRRGFKTRSSLSTLSKVGLKKYSKELLKSHLVDLGWMKDKNEYAVWQIQKDAILFQKFLPGNQYDTRITVIGDRAFAFRRFVRKDDFRASGSGNFDMNPQEIDTICLKIAFDISKKMNFNTMAYDFIYDANNQPHICEISYGFVYYILEQCPGYWDDKLNWFSGHFSPQKCQLEDFLGIELK
jgi:hypothetical protein